MGLITRTAEMGNSDPSDNRDHYYLSDAMGGNVGLYIDDDGDPDMDSEPRTSVRSVPQRNEPCTAPLYAKRQGSVRADSGSRPQISYVTWILTQQPVVGRFREPCLQAGSLR